MSNMSLGDGVDYCDDDYDELAMMMEIVIYSCLSLNCCFVSFQFRIRFYLLCFCSHRFG